MNLDRKRFGSSPLLALAAVLATLVVAVGLAACGSGDDSTGGGETSSGETAGNEASSNPLLKVDNTFFDPAVLEEQIVQSETEPEGPADKPWEQMIDPQMVDTAKFAVDGDWHVCMSNIAVNNPWRTQGAKTAELTVENDPRIGEYTYLDAEGDDNKQISDIESLLDQGCDAMIVAPFTADALTPAVERACKSGVPVILLSTEVNTDCPTSFVTSIGGYAWGDASGKFIAENTEGDDQVIALRILPGVAELEWRWSAAAQVFKEEDVNVVAVNFTEQDPAKTKQAVSDAIQRFGEIKGVWMDAGAAGIPAIEAFEDAGLEVPPIIGEDENQFLEAWVDQDLTAQTPTFPNYQWRTSIIAATKILAGEPVPKKWVLPQPVLGTIEEAEAAIEPELGPAFYSECGCRDFPQFPGAYE